MIVEGVAKAGAKTKELVKELSPGDIAVIAHPDLDNVAAQSLVEAKVKAVINTQASITGRYPNLGPSQLLKHSVPLLDVESEDLLTSLDGRRIRIDCSSGAVVDVETEELLCQGRLQDEELIKEKLSQARDNLQEEVERFIDNTLDYARREKDFVLGAVEIPKLKTEFAGRDVVVVVRGQNYKEDLATILSYIEEVDPVLVGVDGGADALMDVGLQPDLIVGDMDSVSDVTLRSGAELLVHAYPDGRAPGLERLGQLGIEGKTISAPGTSEDIALLVAYELGAELIVAVGTHSNIIDFLEKGRPGMASTFLVRLKVGNILVDAKGVSRLYQGRPGKKYALQIAVAAIAPLLLIALMSPVMRQFLRLIAMQLKLSVGW
ncbi:MAG: hypothetical protein GX030_10555 [Firmicutes bacterium]|nr:hypothetical protein [Bacillota bacterium]